VAPSSTSDPLFPVLVRRRGIELVFDFAHDLGHDVLDSNDAGGGANSSTTTRKVPLSLLEFQQQLGEDFRLGTTNTLRMIG